MWKARYTESRPYAGDSGTSSAGQTRISIGKLIVQSLASIVERTSRSASTPTSRGTAYSISRKTTVRLEVKTLCGTSE